MLTTIVGSASQSHIAEISHQLVEKQGITVSRPSHRRSFSYSATKTIETDQVESYEAEEGSKPSFPLQVLDVFRRSISYSSSLVGLGQEGKTDWEQSNDRRMRPESSECVVVATEPLSDPPEIIVVPNLTSADDGLTHRSFSDGSVRRFPSTIDSVDREESTKEKQATDPSNIRSSSHSAPLPLSSSPAPSGWSLTQSQLLPHPFRMIPLTRGHKRSAHLRRRAFEGLTYRSVTRPLLICFLVTLLIHLLNCYRAAEGGRWQPSMCPF